MMKKSPNSRKSAPRSFQVVATGIRRDEPDISRLMKAALEHYRATSAEANRPSEDRGCKADGATS